MTSSHGARPLSFRHRLTFAAALVAAAVTVSAAPQTDDYGGAPRLTVNGQPCQCMVEFLCDASKIVSIPPGSKDCGASNLACCRLNSDPLGPLIEATTADTSQTTSTTRTSPTRTSTQRPQRVTTTTREPDVEPNQERQCRCVPSKECSMKNYDTLPDIDIRISKCGRTEICCNKEDIISRPEKHEENAEYDVGRSCGVGMLPPDNYYNSQDLGTRIVNTEENSKTYFGQFPWMAVILKTTTDPKTGARLDNVFQCGGSLIHSRVIITAAHCVSEFNVHSLKVRVGEWDTQSADNDDEVNSHQDFTISEIIIHPNHHNGTMFNDVALIQLSSPVVLQKHINTICIPTNKQVNYDTRSCISTGWGKNGFGGKNDRYQTVLKQVHLSIVPHDTCQKQLRDTRLGDFFILDESFICAGGVRGEDVCKGDGGGPLICPLNDSKSNQKKYIQVGIVSWGIGCGDEKIPGVYSSLVANAPWINKNLKILT